MAPIQNLLTDDQVRDFIINGYLQVYPECPSGFHDGIYAALERVFEEEGGPGDSILTEVPDLRKVFEHPVTLGALVSLLGEDYVMSRDVKTRLSPPGAGFEEFERDEQLVARKEICRLHAFYYPQGVTKDLAPTLIHPGSHYLKTTSSGDDRAQPGEPKQLAVPAGTVVLIHPALIVMQASNSGSRNCYVLKFSFERKSTTSAEANLHLPAH